MIMQDDGRDTDMDHGLRLEDISRRSACDRCRTMKTRCERSHHRSISQLEQCRRCRQAQVKCITTLETQQTWSDDSHQPSRRHRKRPREASIEEANSTYQIPATPQSLGDPPKNTRQEHYPAQTTFEMPSPFSILTKSKPTGRLPLSPDVDAQWHELSKMVNLQGSDMTNPNVNIAISSTNHNSEMEDLPGSMFMSSATMPNILGVTQFNQTASTDPTLLWSDLPSLPTPDLSGTESPKAEANWTIINSLMDFNTELLHDLQDARDADRAWGDSKDMLRKTLQRSNTFLELLGNFTRPRDTPARNPQYPLSTGAQCRKVGTDMALQLLSCNMNMSSMYEILCKELTTQVLQMEEAQALTALRLEGLQNLDVEMRLQVLVHICWLTFTKIQTELDWVRRRGSLTPEADAIFHAVRGGGSGRATRPVFDEESLEAKFRRLVMSKTLST